MAFNSTTGLGVAAQIVCPGNSTFTPNNTLTLSLSASTFPTTFQLNPNIEDAGGNEITPGTAFVLASVASSSGNTAVYTGTITGGGTNAFAGETFVVAGFVTTVANNGTFICTASSGSTLTLENANAVSETHAATATNQETGNSLTYVAYPSKNIVSGTSTAICTVSATGLVTAVATGGAVVEVSYPTFNNAVGDVVSSGNPMNGLPIMKIYKEVNVQVVL